MCCKRLAGNTGWKNDFFKSQSEHHRTTLLGYIFATKACIDNRKKKLVNQQYLPQLSLQYGELRPTNGWDRLVGLGHPIISEWLSPLGSVTAQQSSSGHQPNFVALNRGCNLWSAGRRSRWELAHIPVRAGAPAYTPLEELTTLPQSPKFNPRRLANVALASLHPTTHFSAHPGSRCPNYGHLKSGLLQVSGLRMARVRQFKQQCKL